MEFTIKAISAGWFTWSLDISQLKNLLFESMEHCNICQSLLIWECITSISEFSAKSITTPEALEMLPECQMDFSCHSFSHFLAVSGVECVSCKKVISAFLLINKSGLLSSCNSFTFSVVICSCVVGRSQLVWLNFSESMWYGYAVLFKIIYSYI